MRISMNTLNIAMVAVGISILAAPVAAQTRFYDPANKAASAGNTVGYELFGTIGCPGRQLLDPPARSL